MISYDTREHLENWLRWHRDGGPHTDEEQLNITRARILKLVEAHPLVTAEGWPAVCKIAEQHALLGIEYDGGCEGAGIEHDDFDLIAEGRAMAGLLEGFLQTAMGREVSVGSPATVSQKANFRVQLITLKRRIEMALASERYLLRRD